MAQAKLLPFAALLLTLGMVSACSSTAQERHDAEPASDVVVLTQTFTFDAVVAALTDAIDNGFASAMLEPNVGITGPVDRPRHAFVEPDFILIRHPFSDTEKPREVRLRHGKKVIVVTREADLWSHPLLDRCEVGPIVVFRVTLSVNSLFLRWLDASRNESSGLWRLTDLGGALYRTRTRSDGRLELWFQELLSRVIS